MSFQEKQEYGPVLLIAHLEIGERHAQKVQMQNDRRHINRIQFRVFILCH